MSARKSIYVIKDVPCDGGVSPNAYKAQITVEIRAFFPPNTVERSEVFEAMADTYGKAFTQALAFFDERDQ